MRWGSIYGSTLHGSSDEIEQDKKIDKKVKTIAGKIVHELTKILLPKPYLDSIALLKKL